jgi:hypothetical protein
MPLKIDIASLTAKTSEAIRIGEAAARAKIEHEKRMEDAKRLQEEAKAGSILAQVPARAEAEAKVGRNHAIIMGMTYGDGSWTGNTDHNTIQPYQLVGAARLVWEQVEAAGLKPTLDFWHDGVGINGGFNIVIHWPKTI